MTKIDEDLVALPEDEQVARGQELMSLLFGGAQAVGPMASELDSECDDADMDWNVIVKRGFIEVVIPPCVAARRRANSEPALPCFEKVEDEQWKTIVPDKLQDSDASTNVSLEAEDFDEMPGESAGGDVCGSSDGEGDKEAMPVPAPLAMSAAWSPACQYVESPACWWMPMTYGAAAPAICPTASNATAAASWNYDAPVFVPTQWVDPSMGTVACHGSHAIETREAATQEWRTTVMIRNMPNNYTREMLLELVDTMGFAGSYDFAYLPVDFQSQAGLGYAFINFGSVADAQACFDTFEGFSNWKLPSEKVCTVTWSSPTQGLESHIDRYRNSPVMHPSLPDEWKPVLLQQGMRVAFPPPTKAIKTPKVRQHPSGKNAGA